MTNSKDLFDDSTMTFGEHLAVLRTHLIRALLGVSICVIVALFYGDRIVAFVRAPIDKALRMYDITPIEEIGQSPAFFSWGWWKQQTGLNVLEQEDPGERRRAEIKPLKTGNPADRTVEVQVLPSEIGRAHV